MLVPIQWLKDYVDITEDIDSFADKMIMSGSNIETVEKIGCDFEKVVVGKVLSVDDHPNADRLHVCQVEVGQEEPIQIVCGAPNVHEGAIVPVALHGAKLPGGVKIKKGKLRDVPSNGMICSAEELGWSDKVVPLNSKDGIWLLGDESLVGKDFKEAFETEDQVIDFEITPNRPDCLSMLGMAREAAATLDIDIKLPETDLECKGDGDAADRIEVQVEDGQACPRYMARLIQDVKIEQSPWWLQKRLMAAGMRPINNIVDITNFVMLEIGQPLHAFDIRTVAGEKIVVRYAEKDELFTTLDGKERTMFGDTLMICDAEKPLAIAGIMGGLNSEIEEDTTEVLLESANFEMDRIRKTSKKLGLRTESSSRFEKGIDSNLAELASDRFCYLLEKLGAGKVAKGKVDVYKNPRKSPRTDVRIDRINKFLGTKLHKKEVVEYLRRLGIEVEDEGSLLHLTPPTFRLDLSIEEDYIEEVARLYGYDKLPMTIPFDRSISSKGKKEEIRAKLRDSMSGLGFDEIQTYSFVSPSGLDKIRIGEDSWERAFVQLMNPLGEENSVMRTILTPSMLEVLAWNINHGNDRALAYEIGSTFMDNPYSPEALPEESENLSLGCYGEGLDFFFLKGAIEEVIGVMGIEKVKFLAEKDYGPYHPGRCARIVAESQGQDFELGIFGEIHPDVAKNFDIDQRIYAGELFMDSIYFLANSEKHYSPLAKFPSTSRDIAIVVDEDVQVGDIKELILANGGDILSSAKVFDIYRGEQIQEGKKSVAFSLTFRHMERTLTDEEVQPVYKGILDKLASQFKAMLREI